MKGNSTFIDGAGNQTNLILLSQSNAKGGVIHFAKDLFRKVKTLFVQEDISEIKSDIAGVKSKVDEGFTSLREGDDENRRLIELLLEKIFRLKSHNPCIFATTTV